MFVQESLNPIFGLPSGYQQDFESQLASKINQLVANDFPALVEILYRIDVNEGKVKRVLKENPEKDAGQLIAGLIIERMLEKYESRSSFRPNSDGPDDDKW